MYIVTVVPVSRGIGVQELTYYSAVFYRPGSFIVVTVRGKEKPALVLSVEEVKDMKSVVRKSGFVLQKIRRQKESHCITEAFVRAVQKTARQHATNVGSALYSFVPNIIFNLNDCEGVERTATKPRLRGYIVPRVYQGLTKSRIDFYRASIRETFAAKGSVFIVTPTVRDAERVYEELSGGIEEYAFVVHGRISKIKQKSIISKLLAEPHPILIVAPFQFLSLPRHDLATIIVERESSSLYRSRQRPFLDGRVLAHALASELGGQLYLADLPLRIESIYRRDAQEYEEIVTGEHRMHFPTKAEILNVQGSSTVTSKKTFRALHQVFLERIRDTAKHGGRTFLYVTRRGLAPVTLCRDCGTVVMCNECSASVVLHKGKEENYFLCHSCGALRHAREVCVHCKGWRLEAFGIGSELVERELADSIPEQKVLVLSSDTAKTHTAAQKIVSEFYATPQSILVGTEMALPYLTKHVPFVGVVSLDSLLSLASWNIYERVASTLTRLRELAGESILLQTRRPEADILRTILSGNFSAFYRNELRVRKQLGYPPYTLILKVSVTDRVDIVRDRMDTIVAHLAPYELVPFLRPLKVANDQYVLNGFLRIKREDWPDEDLLQKLLLLPPYCTVQVDPDSIL